MDKTLFLDRLIRIHELVWQDDDLMEQDTLFDLQSLVDAMIRQLVDEGDLQIKTLDNGYITDIKTL